MEFETGDLEQDYGWSVEPFVVHRDGTVQSMELTSAPDDAPFTCAADLEGDSEVAVQIDIGHFCWMGFEPNFRLISTRSE
ncbi:MAG: hypothetical protein JW940_29400 [Polyangiaceae bacterium]|nr:hypothetical protein [Polyangiaceae bacterium]